MSRVVELSWGKLLLLKTARLHHRKFNSLHDGLSKDSKHFKSLSLYCCIHNLTYIGQKIRNDLDHITTEGKNK